MPGKSETRDFFISYTGIDERWAEWIATVAEEEGFTTLLQSWDFAPGSNFILEMHYAATIAERTLLVLSDAALEAPYAASEWAAALVRDPTGENRTLIPVRVSECDPPGLLKAISYIDLVGHDEDGARRVLVRGLQAAVVPRRSAPVSAADGNGAAFPGRGGSTSNAPRALRWFTGRESDLELIEAGLSGGDAGVVVVTGLGGIGKTRLAAEFSKRRRDRYRTIWWIRGDNVAVMRTDLASLADALRLPAAASASEAERLEAVYQWLEARTDWLLVIDNARTAQPVLEVLPSSGRGHVLITTQNAVGWEQVAARVPLSVWERDTSTSFIRRRTTGGDDGAAAQLAAVLGDLPLALEQAAAYIDAKAITIGDYIDRLREHAPELFREGAPVDYERTVATTWLLAFNEVRDDPRATTLLRVASVLAPERIPRAIFVDAEPAGGGEASTRFEVDQAVAALRRWSLIDADDRFLNMHRLAQWAARADMRPSERQEVIAAAQLLLGHTTPDDTSEPSAWPIASLLLPHVLETVEHAREWRLADRDTAALLRLFSYYLRSRGELPAAERLAADSVRILRALPQVPEHEFSNSLVVLGLAQAYLDPHEAKRTLQEALTRLHRVEPPDGPTTADILNILSLAQQQAGDAKSADETMNEALRITRKHFAEDHPNVVNLRGNRASTLREIGDLEAARREGVAALAGIEAALGPRHPEVATALGALARIERESGNPQDALRYLERAVEILERSYGKNHLEVARALHDMSSIYGPMGDMRKVRRCLSRVVAIYDKAFDSDPSILVPTLIDLRDACRRPDDVRGTWKTEQRIRVLSQGGPVEPSPRLWADGVPRPST